MSLRGKLVLHNAKTIDIYTHAHNISIAENLRLRLSQFASHIAMQYVMDLVFSCIFKMDYERNTINVIDDRGI